MRRVVAPAGRPIGTTKGEVVNLPMAASAVLALQRSAGNAAVAALLQRTPKARTLPNEPQSLSAFSSVAGEIAIDTQEETLGPLSEYFKGGQGHDRAGLNVEVRFPQADMAAKAGDAKAEKKVRDGLASIALAMFNLHDRSTGQPRVDVVKFLDLNLTQFGGQEAHYRFASVARKFATVAGKSTLSEVDVVVERLGPRRPAPKPLDRNRRLDLENRFSSFGYTRQSIDLRLKHVIDFKPDEFDRVLQALELLPPDVLGSVRDLVWTRSQLRRAPKGEPGEYEYTSKPLVRRLTLYDDAFAFDDDAFLKLLAHEIGHGVSFKPSETAGPTKTLAASAEYQAAAKLDGGLNGAITEYGRTNFDEHFAEAFSYFATEPDTLKLLRPNLFAFFVLQQKTGVAPPTAPPPKAGGSGSGSGTVTPMLARRARGPGAGA